MWYALGLDSATRRGSAMYVDKRLSINVVCVNCGEKLPAACVESEEYDVTIVVDDHVCKFRDFAICKVVEHVFVDGVCAQCGKRGLTPRAADEGDSQPPIHVFSVRDLSTKKADTKPALHR